MLQTLYTLSDDQTEYQLRHRLSFMRFAGLALAGRGAGCQNDLAVPRATGARRRGAAPVRAVRRAAAGQGLPGDGRSDRRRDRDPGAPAAAEQGREGHAQGGGVPSGWSPARRAQIDRDGRWTIKRGRKATPPPGAAAQRPVEIAMPTFGYKNHIGIDRAHGFIRRFTVTPAARHDGSQLAAVLDPRQHRRRRVGGPAVPEAGEGPGGHRLSLGQANLALLERRGLVAQFQRAKPRGRPMPAHIARGNATRARVRSRVEHVFAATTEVRMGLVVRTVGLARADRVRSRWPTSPTI